MATYKKHGNKHKKSRSEKIEQKSATAKFFSKLDYNASLFEDWVSRNQKALFGVIGVAIVAVLGYMAYTNFVMKPRQEEAVQRISVSMDYFNRAMQLDPGANQDTLLLNALNGVGGYGLLSVIDNYGGTEAANVAHYTAGMAYLKLGNYDEAINQLQQFSSDDEMLAAIAKGAIGDAYVQSGQIQRAVQAYAKAANARTNNFTTPNYLLKAAVAALEVNQAGKAKSYLTRIKNNYPDSPEAAKVAIYLGKAENALN